MTDPIIDALDEFIPRFESAEGDWQAILKAASPVNRRSRHRLLRARLPQWRRRRLLVAVALLTTTALVTAAVAAALGAFNGIGAAQHPQTGADVIDPATAAYLLEGKNCNGPGEHACQPIPGGLQLDTTRHIGQLPDGQNVYVVTGSLNDLCTVVGPPNAEVECGDPLSDSHPATIFGYYAHNDPSARWIVFGLALDDVTSVSFQPTEADAGGGPAGAEVTVPVNDNLWVYPSNDAWPPDVLQPFTVHFADGTTVVEPATGKNCAAC